MPKYQIAIRVTSVSGFDETAFAVFRSWLDQFDCAVWQVDNDEEDVAVNMLVETADQWLAMDMVESRVVAALDQAEISDCKTKIEFRERID